MEAVQEFLVTVAVSYCASCIIDEFHLFETQAFIIDHADCNRLNSDFFLTFIHEKQMGIQKLTKILTIIDVSSAQKLEKIMFHEFNLSSIDDDTKSSK